MHLEANTKPHIHHKFEIFGTNIASTMAYPNSKNEPKNGLHLLGIKSLEESIINVIVYFWKIEFRMKCQNLITSVILFVHLLINILKNKKYHMNQFYHLFVMEMKVPHYI